MATANIGPEFVGTLPLDGAVQRRFPYGVPHDQSDGVGGVETVGEANGYQRRSRCGLGSHGEPAAAASGRCSAVPSGAIVGTRILLSIAKRIAKRNTEPRKAVISTLRAQFGPGDDAALSVVIDSFFPKKPVSTTPTATVGATIVTERHWFIGGSVLCEKVLTDGALCGRVQPDPIHFGS